MFDYDSGDYPFTSVEKRTVNSVSGIAYLCNACQVRGLAPHESLLACWCCDGTDLHTKVDLALGGTTAYSDSNQLELPRGGSQRSDDN